MLSERKNVIEQIRKEIKIPSWKTIRILEIPATHTEKDEFTKTE